MDCRVKPGNDELRKPKKERKKRKEAERRQTQYFMSAPAGAVAPRECRLAPTLRCGRARLSAFHHGSCLGSNSIPKGSASGQASWDVDGVLAPWFPRWGRMSPVGTGVTRPALSQSSDRTSPTARSGGLHDARSRPGADRNSARGHRTRPGLRVYLPKRPS
jgi:hypothetical protein